MRVNLEDLARGSPRRVRERGDIREGGQINPKR